METQTPPVRRGRWTTPVAAMVRKDLQIFFTDRRSVILSFIVPIAIASFFGSIFSGSGNGDTAKVDVAIVDHDSSIISRGIVADARTDKTINLLPMQDSAAQAAVRTGKIPVAVVIPSGFGDASGRAFFGSAPKPVLQMLYDPSHRTELAMVGGLMTQHVMQVVSREMFSGAQGRALVDETLHRVGSDSPQDAQRVAFIQMLRGVQGYYATSGDTARAAGAIDSSGVASGSTAGGGGITLPYTVQETALTSSEESQYNGYAHAFGGMGIQFLLFAMANMGAEMLLERERGLWRRVRSAPVSRMQLLGGKVVSGTLISLLTLWVSFAFAMVVFHVRIGGSVAGFALVSIACAIMAATFGLLVAALGRTPASARAVTTLAVLMMVMLGGAWIPSFVFPAWMQQATKAVPVRWAVDGIDATTWRGLGFGSAIGPAAVLIGFAVVFGLVAGVRFRWEEA